MSTIVTGGTEWDPETDRCLLKSVAEKEQAEFLLKNDCFMAQGWLFDKALDASFRSVIR